MSVEEPNAVEEVGPDGSRTPVLYHMHIPKTAGTSLYAALAGYFPPGKVCPVRISSLDLIRMPPEELAAFDLIGGHLEFGYHLPRILDRPVRAVTLLRQPHSVLLSLYKQVMQEPLDPMRKYVDENCPTMEDFFFDPLMSRYVANTQTRYLASAERRFTPEFVTQLRSADPGDISRLVFEMNLPLSPDPGEVLGLASGRLWECAVVGLVERIDESLARICSLHGWPPPAAAPRYNVSRIDVEHELEPHIVARLDQLSALDRELYAEAVRRFDAVGVSTGERPPLDAS